MESQSQNPELGKYEQLLCFVSSLSKDILISFKLEFVNNLIIYMHNARFEF